MNLDAAKSLVILAAGGGGTTVISLLKTDDVLRISYANLSYMVNGKRPLQRWLHLHISELSNGKVRLGAL